MIKVGIMQPYLFPYIGYFQLINLVDTYVIYDDVQYIKGGWINRNNLLLSKQKTLFTIKLLDASPNKLINEILIADDFSKFIKTLEMAYSKAPYKEDTIELIKQICDFPNKNLAKFAGNSIVQIAKHIGIDTRFIYSSDLKKDSSLRSQEKVIAICKLLKADEYINALGGQSLYDRQNFKQNGINIRFIESLPTPYTQFGQDFISGLSIIDILMFNSREDVKLSLESYRLL